MLEVISERAGHHQSVAPAGTFTGEVWRDLMREHGNGPAIGSLFFAPSARTYWHVHEGGQLLIAMAGGGWVGDADGVVRLAPGQMVWTPADVSHWHGASADQYLVYTTISWGKAIWASSVSEQDYRLMTDAGSQQHGPRP